MSVCELLNVATIEIHKSKDKYYLNIIAHNEVAEIIGVPDGLWSESKSLSNERLHTLLTALSNIKYY